MIDILDVERIDGDLWIVCNDENVLMVEDDEAIELGEKLLDAGGAAYLKNARKALFKEGFCGDGNLAEMITRALNEAKQRGRDEMLEVSNALTEASAAFPDEMTGTVAERVRQLVIDQELTQKLLIEWALALDEVQDNFKIDHEKYKLASEALFAHAMDILFKGDQND